MHAQIKNGVVVEYPIINLRQRLPESSLPEDLSNDAALPEGFVYVHAVAAPAFNPATHKLVGGQPVLVGERWQVGYILVELDANEAAQAIAISAQEIRDERNRRLAACDWTQLSDAQVDKPAWAAYRQALRDITEQPGFPLNVEWPTQPQ